MKTITEENAALLLNIDLKRVADYDYLIINPHGIPKHTATTEFYFHGRIGGEKGLPEGYEVRRIKHE